MESITDWVCGIILVLATASVCYSAVQDAIQARAHRQLGESAMKKESPP
jgi:hypothetical protein